MEQFKSWRSRDKVPDAGEGGECMYVKVQTFEFRKMNTRRNREIKETLELQSDKCGTGEQGGEVDHASVTHA